MSDRTVMTSDGTYVDLVCIAHALQGLNGRGVRLSRTEKRVAAQIGVDQGISKNSLEILLARPERDISADLKLPPVTDRQGHPITL